MLAARDVAAIPIEVIPADSVALSPTPNPSPADPRDFRSRAGEVVCGRGGRPHGPRPAARNLSMTDELSRRGMWLPSPLCQSPPSPLC